MNIYLNKNVNILPKGDCFEYINPAKNTYVMVNEGTHKIIQMLCNAGTFPFKDQLSEMKMAHKDFREMITYLFDRYIIEIEISGYPHWKEVSENLTKLQKPVACWDICKDLQRNDVPIKSCIEQLILDDFYELRIVCDNTFNNEVGEFIKKYGSPIRFLSLQFKMDNKSEWSKYEDYIDQINFVVSIQDIVENTAEISNLYERLNLRMPKAPFFIIEQCDLVELNRIANMDIEFDVKIKVSGINNIISETLWSSMSDTNLASSNVDLVYDDLKKAFPWESRFIKDRVYLSSDANLYYYSSK